MAIPFTDTLRTTQQGKIVEAIDHAMIEVNEAAIRSKKPAEMILKVKVVPDPTGGRQTSLEFEISTKIPRAKLPKGIFWMSDNYELLRADPDQREMFKDVTDGSRPYTPPRAVGDE